MRVRIPVGAMVLAAILLVVFIGPLLWPQDPITQDLAARFRPPAWAAGGSPDNLLGTDELGRDILARTLVGGQVSTIIGLSAATLAAVVGLLLGLVAGYYENGWFDRVVARLIDVQLSFPLLVMAIVVVGLLGSSPVVIIVVLGAWGWATIARVARAETRSRGRLGYVEAAHAIGASDFRLMVRHILPNLLPSVLVLWTVAIGEMIVLEGALGFIGLGVNPPTPSWGNIINDGRQVMGLAPWVVGSPALALVATVIAYNSTGDAVSRLIDPRAKQR